MIYKLKIFSRTSTSALKVVITAVTTLHAPTPLVDSNVLALADLKVIHFLLNKIFILFYGHKLYNSLIY